MIDLLQRYGHLQELADDPLVLNEDGTQVDPFLEIAAEVGSKPRTLVSFEERNAVMAAVRMAQAAGGQRRQPQGRGSPFASAYKAAHTFEESAEMDKRFSTWFEESLKKNGI